jgi:spermidine synthase
MNILEKKYDPVIESNVITRYEKPIFYLDFDNINESKLDENNPNIMVCPYTQKMADLCNKNKNDKILLGGLGGGTIFPAIKPKRKSILDCIDLSAVVIQQYKKYFYPVLKNYIDPNLKIKIHNIDLVSYVNKCKKKYNKIMIDCFKVSGIDESIFTIFNYLPKILEKDGRVIINIHSSRYGKYSFNFRKIRKYFDNKLWKVKTHLSNTKDSYEFGNLIIELLRKSL